MSGVYTIPVKIRFKGVDELPESLLDAIRQASESAALGVVKGYMIGSWGDIVELERFPDE